MALPFLLSVLLSPPIAQAEKQPVQCDVEDRVETRGQVFVSPTTLAPAALAATVLSITMVRLSGRRYNKGVK